MRSKRYVLNDNIKFSNGNNGVVNTSSSSPQGIVYKYSINYGVGIYKANPIEEAITVKKVDNDFFDRNPTKEAKPLNEIKPQEKLNNSNTKLKEFYEKNKKTILITGGILGGIILLKVII